MPGGRVILPRGSDVSRRADRVASVTVPAIARGFLPVVGVSEIAPPFRMHWLGGKGISSTVRSVHQARATIELVRIDVNPERHDALRCLPRRRRAAGGVRISGTEDSRGVGCAGADRGQ